MSAVGLGRYRSYPGYKDSGVEWIGEIPEHWHTARHSYYFKSAMGETILTQNLDDSGGIPVYSATESGSLFGYVKKANVRLEPGDLIIPARGNSIGYVKLVKQRCTATQTTIYSQAISSSNIFAAFVRYYLLAYRKVLFFFDRTAIPQITVSQVSGNPLILPPLPEQRAIAAFLGRETARIDALVAHKRRLIELLQEQRSALITQAVTQGLDPHVEMKESGVEWLGRVPTGWQLKPIWAVSKLQRGFDLTTSEREPGVIPVYSSSGQLGFHSTAKVRGPGVITGRYGTIGEVYYEPNDFWPMNTSLFVDDFWGNNRRFVFYLLQTLQYDAFSGKSAVPGIDRNDLHRLKVYIPDLHEQTQIAGYLDQLLPRYTKTIDTIGVAIDHLNEYRTALISAAVTGKIDVRGEVESKGHA